MTSRAGRRRLLLGGWLAWATAVLVAYFPKLGELVLGGPGAWADVQVFDGPWPSSPSLPFAAEAAARAGGGLLGAALVLSAAHAAGSLVCRALRWRGEGAAEALLFPLAAGLFVLAQVSLVLLAVDAYRRPLLVVLLLAGASVSAVRAWRRRALVPRPRLPEPAERPWAVVVVLALLLGLVGALAPEREFDALWWHLDLPRRWLDAGGFVDLPAEYVSLYPMAWETVFGAGMAVGGTTAAKVLHFACLPLAALLVAATARRWFPGASPWLAAALLVAAPTVLWEATTAYVDLAAALHLGLAGYALLRSQLRTPGWLVLAGANAGLAITAKHLALLALAILAGLVALGLWRRRHRLGVALGSAAALVALALLPALPWYARSWEATGNPVFPELYEVFGAPADRWDDTTEAGLDGFKDRFGFGRTAADLVALPWTTTVHGARFGGTLGPAFLLLLPALALGAVRRGEPARWVLAFAGGYLALWASPLSSFQLRFLVLVVPALAVLGAVAWRRLQELGRSAGRRAPALLTGGLALVLLLGLPPMTPYAEAQRRGDEGWLTHVVRTVPLPVVVGAEDDEDYLARAVPSSVAWRHVNDATPEDAVVLSFAAGDNLLSRRARIPHDATRARPALTATPAGATGAVEAALADLGVSHILFDRRVLAPGEAADGPALASPTALRCWYDEAYDDGRYLLVGLRWSAGGLPSCGAPPRPTPPAPDRPVPSG